MAQEERETILKKVEKEPEYKGGMEQFYVDVNSKIHYPIISRIKRAQGNVFVQFVVNKEGKLEDVKVVKGIEKRCDQVAADAVKSTSGKWIPGEEDGKPVKVRMVLPLTFNLNAKKAVE